VDETDALIGWVTPCKHASPSLVPQIYRGVIFLKSDSQPRRLKATGESNMSSQDGTSIPFSASYQQQAFKLLELPPELLALLESDNPPM
jgi:hypothetical protein